MNEPGIDLAVAAIDLHGKGQIEEAKKLYRVALRINPRLAVCLGNLALIVPSAEEAESLFRQALQIEPDNLTVLMNYGKFLETNNRVDEAIVLFEKRLTLDPKNQGTLLTLHGIYEARQNDADAKRIFRLIHKTLSFESSLTGPTSQSKTAALTGHASPVVLITAPDNIGYERIIAGFVEGFNEIGINCLGSLFQDRREGLLEWANRERPKLVLEINHMRRAGENWPEGTHHALWLQDIRWEDVLTAVSGSTDKLYCCGNPKTLGADMLAGTPVSILYPGARNVSGAENVPKLRDFSITGFIYPPLTVDTRLSVARDRNGRNVSLAEFLVQYPERYTHHYEFEYASINRALKETAEKMGVTLLPLATVLFDTIIPRTFDRSFIVRQLKQITESIGIYGSTNWKLWPEFRDLHKDYVSTDEEMDDVFRTTRINVHNGPTSMHYRTIDCMATGSVVMINRTPRDSEEGGIDQYLEVGRHYVSYNLETISEVGRQSLADHAGLKRMAAEARKEILGAHMWKHRAMQVAKDFGL
jgi:hypothetical protein